MDALAELRNVWHGFEAGSVGPEGVVAAARRACGSGVQRRAPSLAQLANLQPAQYGHVSALFVRVRSELQATAAQAQTAQAQVAQAQSTQVQTGQVQMGQAQMAQLQSGQVQAGAVQSGQFQTGQAQTAQAQLAYAPQAYGEPSRYVPPGAYPAQAAYGGHLAAVPMNYVAVEPGLPPGVHGISPKELKELRRTGWICAVGSLFIGLLAIMAIVNGNKLTKAGDSQGKPMTIIGWVMLGLTALYLVAVVGGG